MHDFTTTTGPHFDMIGRLLLTLFSIILLIFIASLICFLIYLYLRKDIAGFFAILAIIFLMLVVALGSTLPTHYVQTYKGTFKVDKTIYNNQTSNQSNNLITVQNENGNTQTFQYDGDKTLKKNDKVEIKINGKPHTHPSINKSLKEYQTISVTKIN